MMNIILIALFCILPTTLTINTQEYYKVNLLNLVII